MQVLNPSNKLSSLRCDATGALLVAGGGGGGDASAANQTTQITRLTEIRDFVDTLETLTTAIRDRLPTSLLNDRVKVEPLGSAGGIARQLAAAAASANVALTSTCRRVSLFARGADIRYSIGSSAQTATTTSGVATSHYLAQGERIELAVPATPNIAAIRAGTTDGTLEITELL
jgi:hypothetical protein